MRFVWTWMAIMVVCSTGCSRSNNVLLGRVEARVGTHRVVVTDCYRISAPAPEQTGNAVYHYEPCRDAVVWIRGEELSVNGAAYGKLRPGDGVLVDHGIVSLER
jgi:hypothetical protein